VSVKCSVSYWVQCACGEWPGEAEATWSNAVWVALTCGWELGDDQETRCPNCAEAATMSLRTVDGVVAWAIELVPANRFALESVLGGIVTITHDQVTVTSPTHCWTGWPGDWLLLDPDTLHYRLHTPLEATA
jgi:hypothetical protein